MPDRIYAKDPLRVRDNRKFYVTIFVVIAVFLCLQIGLGLFSRKANKGKRENLDQEKERTFFKEQDVAKSLEVFARGAKESVLGRLREKEMNETSRQVKLEKEKLGPVAILQHKEQPTQMPALVSDGPKSLGVPLGTQVIALLRTKIFSFNIENHIEAESVQDVYYLGKLRIPTGTKFFGTVSVLHSENRVNVRFHRLLLPWGEERSCQAVAHALDGSGGIKGKVHRHWFQRTFSIIGKTALSGLTLLTVANRQGAFSASDQLRLTASSNLAQEGWLELDNLRINKSITVSGGIMIKIIFLESL